MSKASKEERLNHLIWTIRSNYPQAASTFGPCSNECGRSARGCGLCPYCAEKELGELINAAHLAELFHTNTRENSSFINDMMKAVEEH